SGIIVPTVFPFDRVRPLQRYQERGKPLLAIENQRDLLNSFGACQLVMCSTLFEPLDKLVYLPLIAVFRLQIPEEERADRIATHDGIEQLNNLLWLPYKLALDGG